MKQKLVLIGNGMAGVRALEELFKHNTSGETGSEQYDITVIGSEPHPNYNRIMLSPVLAGEQTINDIILNSLEWYEENDITLVTGDAASEISRVKKSVITESGKEYPYDRLLIATGSNPFIIPIPGADKEGVLGFRDISDVSTMVQAAKAYKKAVVIGGGLLGLEAANGLMKQGAGYGCHRRASARFTDGAPVRQTSVGVIKSLAGNSRHEIPDGGFNRRDCR
jgi:nitrite reductase (NADH) large subunit